MRYVRITDAGTGNGFPGAAEGFDMDALVVLHGRPVGSAAPDTDGDGLPDGVETTLLGTRADVADSDGDGTDDGREVAGCRDPLDGGDAPFLLREPHLFVDGTDCTTVRWTWLGTNVAWDVLRGDVAHLLETGGTVDLGPLDCLVAASTAVSWSCDGAAPPPAGAWFYLVRRSDDGAGPGTLGRGSSLAERQSGATCP